jgi:hypothetical protein
MLGRWAVFGRHGRMRAAPTPILRAKADDDGIARVFPRTMWEDPRMGKFLREMGLAPDDPQNVLPSPHDYYRSRFADARRDHDLRIEALRRSHAAGHPECRIMPLFLVDLPLWRGRFGQLLCERMGLVAWDEWNVLLLAGDEATATGCGLPLHPGTIPALNVRLTEALHDFDSQLAARLAEARPQGRQDSSPDRVAYLEVETDIRERFLDFVATCRDQVEALLADAVS